MAQDTSILEAALIGYQVELARVTQAMEEIRARLGGGQAKPKPAAASPTKKRTLSAAARKRIAAAQKKRWAEFHKKQAQKD